MEKNFRLLAFPFFVSGFAALIYQVTWQRLLFVSLGVDIESITVIVSTFMLGLGVGALIGGQLADRYPSKIIQLFAVAELLIGLFGIGSPHFINLVGQTTISEPIFIVAASNFLLLLIPTTLMGATLPMLVAFIVGRSGNVGGAIGGLYFVNTMGAAIGAFMVGFIWLYYFEVNATIYSAAFLNILVSASIFIFLGFKK